MHTRDLMYVQMTTANVMRVSPVAMSIQKLLLTYKKPSTQPADKS